MPAPAEGDPVDHVGGPELNVVLRQGLCERLTQLPVLVVAAGTVRAVGVDDHRDDGLGAGRRGDLGQMTDPCEQLLGEVDAHHRPEVPILQRH